MLVVKVNNLFMRATRVLLDIKGDESEGKGKMSFSAGF